MNREFILALEQLEKEKGISKALLIDAIEKALVSAYKKNNNSEGDNVRVSVDGTTGEIEIKYRKTVVEYVEDPETEVSIDVMREFDDDYEIGDEVEYEESVDNFGRIAAQTAKQVVMQSIKEAERGIIFENFIGRKNDIITGNIQRVMGDTVYINVGKTDGILTKAEQVEGERYIPNKRMKFFILDVKDAKQSPKGPQIFLSRSHPGLVNKLFELEVPEIADETVVIENLVREAGSRTKMAVYSTDEGVDPIGACVGNRGTRVQAVVDELGGEKIDIVPWTDIIEDNISNALSPSQVEKVILADSEKSAVVVVPDFQLSLAIGKEGQNVRLAAKLCGVKIDIKSHTQFYKDLENQDDDAVSGSGKESNIEIEDGGQVFDGHKLDDEGFLNPDDFKVEE
ncbi:MAG: transcription termination factor NusA [Clostridiales Family XIII bacterium]|jgi:N utilization substance protein A|nr:transcription termination factor NusA [Clostridiales Family XIII bacterium]